MWLLDCDYVTTPPLYQISAHAAKRKIAEFSSRGEEFLQKYDDLKVRQTRNLDPLVYLLSKVTEDRRLCGFLQAVRPLVEEVGLQEISNVRVLDVVEGEEVELPEKGECVVRGREPCRELVRPCRGCTDPGGD